MNNDLPAPVNMCRNCTYLTREHDPGCRDDYLCNHPSKLRTDYITGYVFPMDAYRVREKKLFCILFK